MPVKRRRNCARQGKVTGRTGDSADAFGNDKKKKTAEDIEKCNRIRRNVADMERTGDYSKALRMFAEELTGFLSYFPKEGTLFVLDEPNRLNERMELILYEYTESMKNRLEGGYILPGQTDMIHGIESIYAGLEKKRTLLLSALDYKPEKFAVAEYVRIDTAVSVRTTTALSILRTI